MTPGNSHRLKNIMSHVFRRENFFIANSFMVKTKRLKFGHGYCINERNDEHNSTNNVVKRKGNQL